MRRETEAKFCEESVHFWWLRWLRTDALVGIGRRRSHISEARCGAPAKGLGNSRFPKGNDRKKGKGKRGVVISHP